MSKKTVIVSECDRCHVTVESPFNKNPLHQTDRYVLPQGWTHVAGNTARTTIFEFDLCADCSRVVREAAGAARS